MRIFRILSIAFAALTAGIAWGQALSYGQQSVNINAAVLLVESQRLGAYPYTPAPHVFSNVDRDRAIKPASWNFTNPLAQTYLTQSSFDRWTSFPFAGPVPGVGSGLTKRSAVYWELNLTAADDNILGQYDILLLALNGTLSLNSGEREKLRKYVDQGGVLWIDLISDGGLNLDLANPLPYPFSVAISAALVDANLEHPLLRYPNRMTLDDVRRLDYVGATSSIVSDLVDLSSTGIDAALSWISADSSKLEPVSGNVDGRTVSVGRLGDGYVVLTTRGVSATLNRGYDNSAPPPTTILANRGFQGLLPVQDTSFTSAAKFLVNAISLPAAFVTSGAGGRKLSGTNTNLQAPLLLQSRVPKGAGAFPAAHSSALFKGYVVITVGDVVEVYDTRPRRDVDGNGDTDDGILDPFNATYDLIWQSEPVGQALSPPTVVEVPNTGLTNPIRGGAFALNQIWVTDAAGNVLIYDLDSPSTAPVPPLAPSPIAPPSASLAGAGGPYAVTPHEGIAFVADTRDTDQTGRVWAIDMPSGTTLTTAAAWAIAGSGRFPSPSASPTVGYIPINDNSGGVDRVVYLSTQNSTGVILRPAGLSSIWLGARGEAPVRVQEIAPTELRLQTRASLKGLPVLYAGGASPLGIKITMLKPNGDPFALTEMQTYLDGVIADPGVTGEIQVGLTGAHVGVWDFSGQDTPATADDVGWRVDYTIDWGAVSSGFGGIPADSYVRGNLEFPDDGTFNRVVLGGPALGPGGNIYVITSMTADGDTSGTLFFLRETGIGDFTMRNRYDLYDDITFSLDTGASAADVVTYGRTFFDVDEVLADFPFLDVPITNIKFVGGPSVQNGVVYAAAKGRKSVFGFPADVSVVMSFRANPDPVEFEVDGLDIANDPSLVLVQPDVSRSGVKTAPTQFSTLQPAQFSIEPVEGTTRTRIIINNLMTVPRGRIRDSISASLPVVIRRSGSTDTLVEPEAFVQDGRLVPGYSSGRFSPLLWYLVLNGYKASTTPVVTGQTMYFAGGSILPSVFAGDPPPFASNGLIYAMDASISPSDPFLRFHASRPWMSQLSTVVKQSATPGDYLSATAIRWPQFNGVESVDDFRIRLMQATTDEADVLNLAAGDGAVVVTGDSTLYAFTKSDFLIADEGRVARFDPAGNPQWTADQTLVAGIDLPTGSASGNVRISEPSRVYPDGETGYWVVDSGNDRIVRLDASGRELRTVERMRIDPGYAPEGLAGLEALKLRNPRDVLVFESRVLQANNPFTNAQPEEYWLQMLIADAGNNRWVQLVDRYVYNSVTGRVEDVVEYADPNTRNPSGTERALGVLYKHSTEELSGKRYAYNSIARTVVDDGGTKKVVVALGFGNVEPGRTTFGLDTTAQDRDVRSGNGGVVVYDGPNTRVITEFTRPAIAVGTFLGEDPPASGSFDFVLPTAAEPAAKQKITGLASVTARYVDDGGVDKLALMIAESTGIYEIVQSDPITAPDDWVVRWMLPREAYVAMRRPRDTAAPYTLADIADNASTFRPMYARRLDSGEVLIVNGYVGTTLGNVAFNGEVALVDGRFGGVGNEPGYDLARPNLGFNSLSIKFELPPVQGVRGLIRPVFAERQ